MCLKMWSLAQADTLALHFVYMYVYPKCLQHWVLGLTYKISLCSLTFGTQRLQENLRRTVLVKYLTIWLLQFEVLKISH